MLKSLLNNYEEAVAIILFVAGLGMLLFRRNLILKLIGMNIMDTGVFLFLASMGYINIYEFGGITTWTGDVVTA